MFPLSCGFSLFLSFSFSRSSPSPAYALFETPPVLAMSHNIHTLNPKVIYTGDSNKKGPIVLLPDVSVPDAMGF